MKWNGFVTEIDAENMKFDARIVEGGQEYEGLGIPFSVVENVDYLIVGGYFVMHENGRVVMNEEKWTEEEIEAAKKEADILFQELRELMK